MKMHTWKMSIWFANYFAWAKLNWKQRKAAIKQRRQGQRVSCHRDNGGPWRGLRSMEPVPRNAQVAKAYWTFQPGKKGYADNTVQRILWLSVRRFPRIIGTRFVSPGWDIRVPV